MKQNLYELRENALVIQGTPLFEDIVSSGGTTQEGDDEADFIDGGEEPHENDEEGTSREVGEPVGSGPPRLELSTSRMVFECFHGQSSTSSLFFHNCGSTALFFQWQFEDSLSSSPPVSTNPSDAASQSTNDNFGVSFDHRFDGPKVTRQNCFYSVQSKGKLAPGQWASLTVTFTPINTGASLNVLRLITQPALEQGPQCVLLKGICLHPDRLKLKRVALVNLLRRDATRHGVEDLLRRVVRAVQPNEPPIEELPKIFYVINRKHGLKLWFYQDNFAEFKQLARDVLDSHKRAVRQNMRWNFSATTLKTWIDNIPARNAVKVDSFRKRWEMLVAAAMIRPLPTPGHYRVMQCLVRDAIKHLPRVSLAFRTALDITEPLINPAPEEEKDEGAKPGAAAAKKKKVCLVVYLCAQPLFFCSVN